MSCKVTDLSLEERKMVSSRVIGKTVCPYCHRTDVKVVNDKGTKGNSRWHYLENHYAADASKNLCLGSERSLHSLEASPA